MDLHESRSERNDAERQRDPFPWYKTMRSDAPVYYDSDNGNWNIFRYADVRQVLRDHPTFSSDLSGRMPVEQRDAIQASMIGMDPPRHHRLRALVSKAFTPSGVNALAPRISAIAAELLDQAIHRGTLDVVVDLAAPLPVTVIAELLGVPAADREHFKRCSDAIVGENTGDADAERELATTSRESSISAANTRETI